MSGRGTDPVRRALEQFADAVQAKFSAKAKGEPEDQLRAPFEALLSTVGRELGHKVICKGETLLAGKQGKPDYATVVDGALTGYVELKAPGAGVEASRFKGHDRSQFKRFSSLPNILYSDGNGFALYRGGERIGKTVRLDGAIEVDGGAAVTDKAAANLRTLLTDFFSWEPIVPASPRQLAEVLAPLCRLLRDEVIDALEDESSPLSDLKRDWQSLLFPDADAAQFADAYAQTVTYALLLARAEGAKDLDSASAATTLQSEHALLSRALQVLTDPSVRAELGSILELLERTVAAVDPVTLTGQQPDPWIYFYEDFLAAYDPALRKNTGVYYTPVQVVRAQVRLADEILRTKLGKARGFAEDDVLTLDPAVGTGTYLLGVIDHALAEIERTQGEGAVPGRATVLAKNLHGFELMVGPYAVAQLRLTRELKSRKATLPKDGINVFLTDTLEDPSAKPRQAPLFHRPIAEEHRRAQKVKDRAPILVCIGNPPYDRHGADSSLGGWVRHGAQGHAPLLEDFLKPARDAGHGGDLKNAYNLYIYFWRWALWKVFEHTTATGPGIVSFISASSFLGGDAFVGMRERMRRHCDEIWIIDLGGDGRGARREDNVFDIQTPVAITIAARYGKPDLDTPANVRYTRIRGDRDAKLSALDNLKRFEDLEWTDCPIGWQDPFRPAGVGAYFRWPRLTELFPWQHSGVEVKRTWPIGPDRATLERRWRALLRCPSRADAMRETHDRKIKKRYPSPGPFLGGGGAIADLPENEPMPQLAPYAYRSFDRQLIIADNRLIDRPRPSLWRLMSDKQLFLTSLIKAPLGAGPAITAAAAVPDRHHFRGSYGGKDVMPLYRDTEGTEPNIRPGLLDQLATIYGKPVSPEDFAAYIACVLAHPGYTAELEPELETPGPRVPMTREAELFDEAANLGRQVLWLHTYGDRFADPSTGRPPHIPAGRAKNTRPVSQEPEKYPEEYVYDEGYQELRVGDGMFAPVSPEVWQYEVSGLPVVSSWLGYRMRSRAGRISSRLDEIQPERWTAELTDQLLELLWVVEGLVALEPAQRALFERILRSPLLEERDLPALGNEHPARKEPSFAPQGQLMV